MMERSDDDCSGIEKQILLKWGTQSPTQIAEELKLELKFVMQILKREQKKIVEQGESSYGEESKG